jgi:hypothetical protein
MPSGDGTGPLGAGPMTGRGAGFCAGSDTAGYENSVPGRAFRGRGFGRGGGRGWRNGFWATGLPGWIRFGLGISSVIASRSDAERTVLQNQAETLQRQLDAIQKRLDAMTADTDVKP